jgi:outer membrane protein assembly factor BamB
MKNAKDKTAIAVALFLTFAMAFSLVALPVANARDPPIEIHTFAYILAAPNPVGVGQKVDIIMFVDKTPGGRGAAAVGNDIRFHDYKLTITKPDGTTETKTWDIVWDPTSSQYTPYTPDQTGEYTLKFEFPGQEYTWSGTYQNDTYLASSATTTLTVQEEEVTVKGSYPLPAEYWTRPIYGENTDWWSISSNWLGTGSPEFKTLNWAYDVAISGAVGSKTAHIMWTRPLQSGGVVGDDNFIVPGDTYFEGTAYANRFTNPIIVAGKLIYTEPLNYGSGSGGATVCVDLRTGELIWSSTDVPSPSFAYIFSYHDMNYHGVQQPTLVAAGGWRSPIPSGMWVGYDADTGTWLWNATNVPSGTKAMGPRGEYLQYVFANAGNSTHPDYHLLQWNSSKLAAGAYLGTGQITGVVDASTEIRYDWNVSVPWANSMVTTGPWGPSLDFTVVVAYGSDILLCYNGTLPGGDSPSTFGRPISSDPYTYFAVNLDPDEGALGSVLWRKTYDAPAGGITVFVSGYDQTAGVFVESYKETMEWVAYNLRTGDKMWGPVGGSTALDYYGNDFGGVADAFIADGKMYYSGMAGIMYCYNVTNGNLLWTYGNGDEGNSTSSGAQMAYGRYPTMIEAIGNGIVYTSVIEHTVTTPIYKGARTRAINATDGTEVYTLSNYGSSWTEAIADGYTTFMNGYDSRVYVVGRGPSATTVSASPKVSVHGDSVLVEGMVIDTAAGTAQDEQAARFPDGVPAVSDESMSDWMEYVYMQRPRPSDVTGVEVVLEVLDPNNNYYEVGRTTSDADGFFSCMFTPEVPGKYTIIATFEGSEGYWPSHAETAIGVEEAPAATPEPTPVPQAPVETYFAVSTIAIIVAIAVAVVLLLRKR